MKISKNVKHINLLLYNKTRNYELKSYLNNDKSRKKGFVNRVLKKIVKKDQFDLFFFIYFKNFLKKIKKNKFKQSLFYNEFRLSNKFNNTSIINNLHSNYNIYMENNLYLSKYFNLKISKKMLFNRTKNYLCTYFLQNIRNFNISNLFNFNLDRKFLLNFKFLNLDSIFYFKNNLFSEFFEVNKFIFRKINYLFFLFFKDYSNSLYLLPLKNKIKSKTLARRTKFKKLNSKKNNFFKFLNYFVVCRNNKTFLKEFIFRKTKQIKRIKRVRTR